MKSDETSYQEGRYYPLRKRISFLQIKFLIYKDIFFSCANKVDMYLKIYTYVVENLIKYFCYSYLSNVIDSVARNRSSTVLRESRKVAQP